jgi:hypothetical protein
MQSRIRRHGRIPVIVGVAVLVLVALTGCGSSKQQTSAHASTTLYTYYAQSPVTAKERQALIKARRGCPATFISGPGKITHIRRLPLALARRCGHYVADPGTPGVAYYCEPHEEGRLCPYPAKARVIDVYTSNAKLIGSCTFGETSGPARALLCTEEAATSTASRKVGVYTSNAKLLGYCTPKSTEPTDEHLVCTEPSA